MKRFALAILIAAAASASLAQGVADGKWWKRPRIADALQLSPAQSSDLERIFAGAKPKLIDLRADLEKKQFAYEQAMLDDKADRKTVSALIESREQARAALQKELSLMELDMKQVLTPPQREQLLRMRENAKQMMQQRRRRMKEDTGGDADLFDAPMPTKKPASQ